MRVIANKVCVHTISAVLALSACAREDPSMYDLIPFPEHISSSAGSFLLSTSTTIALSDPTDSELRSLGAFGAEMLAGTLGSAPQIADEPADQATPNTIALLLSSDGNVNHEGYRLDVTRESIAITAPEPVGLFYGLQTLRQLVPLGILPNENDQNSTVWPIPAVKIQDAPRFVYRGMHLDVGRHFFPVEFIKKYIDLLAMYKMNTFHWHLTEDQGWRIEIKKYPRLTQVGAFRR